MADDPWSDFPDAPPAQEQQTQQQTGDDPWSEFPDAPSTPESNAGAAYLRRGVQSIVPTIGSLPAMGAGATIGAGIGTAIAPGPGTFVGGLVGGAAGAMGGGYLMNKLQDSILDHLGLREGEGFFSRKQEQADIEQHPYASLAGDLSAMFLGFSPARGLATLGERGLGAGMMGGFEAGQELATEGKVDPTKVGMSAVAGFAMPRPRVGAQALIDLGGRPFKPGRPDTAAAAAPEDKAAVDVNDVETVARGVAAENPPVREDVGDQIGNVQSRPVQDAGNTGKYQKQPVTSEPPSASFGWMAPDARAALDKSLGENAVGEARQAGEARTPAKPEELPIPTGIEEATKAALGVKPEEQIHGDPNTDIGWRNNPTEPLGPPPDRRSSEREVIPPGENGPWQEAPTEPVYKHPDADDLIIDRSKNRVIPVWADANRVYINKAVPPLIDVNGKPLDPAYPLAVQEHTRQKLAVEMRLNERRGGPKVADKDRLAIAEKGGQIARDEWLKARGYDPQGFARVMDPILKGPQRVPPRAPTADEAAKRIADVAPPDSRTTVEINGERATLEPRPAETTGKTGELPEAKPVQTTEDAVSRLTGGTSRGAMPNFTQKKGGMPKVVTDTVESLRQAGFGKMADDLLALPPERQVPAAARASALLANKTGKLRNVAKDLSNPRIRNRETTKELEIDDLGVMAGTKKEAAERTMSIDAIKQAFKEHPPVEGETPEQMRERAQKMVERAKELNGGKDPVGFYKPQQPPKEWHALREAQRLLKGNATPKKVNEYIANEKLLRGGDEDVAAFTANRKGEAETARSRRIINPENAPDIVSPEESEKFGGKVEPVLSSDDLAKLSEDKTAGLVADQEKVAENLIKDIESPGEQKKPQWQIDEEKSAEKSEALKAVRLQRTAGKAPKESEGGASEVRKVEITPEKNEAALKALKVAEERGRARGAPEPKPEEQDQGKVPSWGDLVDKFKADTGGTLSVDKVNAAFKARKESIKKGLEKYFGVALTNSAKEFSVEMGKAVSAINKDLTEIATALDRRWNAWLHGAKFNEVLAYLRTLEKTDAYDPVNQKLDHAKFTAELRANGIDAKKAAWMVDEAEFHRQIMDRIYEEDQLHGADYDYVTNYVSHIFSNAKKAADFIENRIQQLGPTWYQKERVFDLLEEAIKAGFKLKHENPIEIIAARWTASVNSNMIVATLRQLEKRGLAYPLKDAPKFAKTWAKKVNTPDHQQWVIHPDGQYIWENALEAKGISQNQTPIGSIYRGWMKLKNVWMPVELSLSAFHELHIIGNIHPAQNLTRALMLSRSDPSSTGRNLLNAAKWSLSDPLFSLPLHEVGYGLGRVIDEMSGRRFSGFEGTWARHFWEKPRDQLTPDEKRWVSMFNEGGMIPGQSSQDIIGARKALAVALRDKKLSAIPQMIRRGIELIQEPMFKYQIPALKSVSYMRSVEAAFKMDPELNYNATKRGIVLREIGKNINDRYGEMFYNNLFWNKYLKDVGIGSMLSLSWNLGQVQQLGGALMNTRYAAAKPVNYLADKLNSPSLREAGKALGGRRLGRAAYEGGDKGTFVTTYVALSMATAGMLSYAMSGQAPTGADYLFPRNGLKNADGTPQRMTTPFNTREALMLKGHAEEQGGGVSGWARGAGMLLWNKMILSPVTEWWSNRDFFGNKLYDPNRQWFVQAAQTIDSLLGAHMNPIAVSGAARAKEKGASPVMSYLGFGPAPEYISNTPLQNRIGHLFNDEGSPVSKPYQYGEKTGLGKGLFQNQARGQGIFGTAGGILPNDMLKSESRQQGRALINQGTQGDNAELAHQGRRELVNEGHMAKSTVMKLRPDDKFHYMFARLPAETQKALVKEMSPAEFREYVLSNHLIQSRAGRADLIKQWSLGNH